MLLFWSRSSALLQLGSCQKTWWHAVQHPALLRCLSQSFGERFRLTRVEFSATVHDPSQDWANDACDADTSSTQCPKSPELTKKTYCDQAPPVMRPVHSLQAVLQADCNWGCSSSFQHPQRQTSTPTAWFMLGALEMTWKASNVSECIGCEFIARSLGDWTYENRCPPPLCRP